MVPQYHSDIYGTFVNYTTKFDNEKTSHMEMNGRAVPGLTNSMTFLGNFFFLKLVPGLTK